LKRLYEDGLVLARLSYLRHLPSYAEHSRFISTTRNVARYRKHPRSTCRWHRARLGMLVKLDHRNGRYLSFFFFTRVVSRGSAVKGERERRC